MDNIEGLKEQLTRKTQECEIKTLEIEGIKKQIDQLKASKEQAEQKLEKIRQFCAKAKDVENINDMYTAKLSGLYLKSRQILQIIDEVENEHN